MTLRHIVLRGYEVVRRYGWGSAAVIGAFSGGVLVDAYWSTLCEYVRAKGVGEAIVKFAPAVSATVAIAVFWWQFHRARYNQRIDLILKLSERFDKPEMRALRAKAARALRRDRNTEEDAVSDVLDFFEEVGFLLHRGAIDVDAVYEFFETLVMPYYQSCHAYIERERLTDDCPDLYSNLDRLNMALTDREYLISGETPERAPEHLDDFLRRESQLVAPPKPIKVDIAVQRLRGSCSKSWQS